MSKILDILTGRRASEAIVKQIIDPNSPGLISPTLLGYAEWEVATEQRISDLVNERGNKCSRALLLVWGNINMIDRIITRTNGADRRIKRIRGVLRNTSRKRI